MTCNWICILVFIDMVTYLNIHQTISNRLYKNGKGNQWDLNPSIKWDQLLNNFFYDN